MPKVFRVEYDFEDQLVNIPDDLTLRINKLQELKSQGYTHIEDEWWTMYTGKRYADINSYLTETKSYL